MTRFAQNTDVPVEKSRAEIERLITRYGATSTAFFNAPDRAMIAFECQGRRMMFELKLPHRDEKRFQKDGRGSVRSPEKRHAAWEQACRQNWRALCLVIKAKLEAVESGITTFEDEFLAHIVLLDGQTLGSHVKPRVAAIYQSGKMLPLLPAPETKQ
jgi:hypothetical protein